MAMLRKGLSGEPVRRLQSKLGIEADGQFGPATENALKEWQRKQGLAADGVAGPDTFAALGLWELVLLKEGTKGATVKKLQEKLAVPADGQFGSATEKAVRAYQQKNGLKADGMAGPATLAHMKVFQEITPEVVSKSEVPAEAAAAPSSTEKMQSAVMQGMAQASASGGKRSQPAPSGEASPPPKRSIWDTLTSVFK